MTTDTQYLDEFLADVEELLRLQKQYFATRNTSALIAAKDKEKFVREKIKAIREERTRKQILTLWPSEK